MRAPALRRLVLLLVVCLLGAGPSPATLLAQDATPDPGGGTLALSTDPERLDLAAMAPPLSVLPEKFVEFDSGYYLTPRGVSLFWTNVTAEEMVAANLVSMFDTFYWATDGMVAGFYLAQFPSQEDVQAGFDALEDESRIAEIVTAEDFPAPDIGEDPSELTVAVLDFTELEGPIVEEVSITFTVGTILATVWTQVPIDPGDGAATPAMMASPVPNPELMTLAEDLSTALDERINAVLAGEDVGVDQSLPSMLLPTDTLWSRPGLANEGYRDATTMLGPEGPAAEFADAYQGGYVRIIAGAPVPDVVFPHRPLVNITVTRFDSADTAMEVLDVADSIPSPPFYFEEPLEEVEGAQVEGTDASRTYHGSFREGEPADSARIAFVSGEYLIFVDVFGNTTVDDAMSIATDIVNQQAGCMASGEACTDVVAPDILPPNQG